MIWNTETWIKYKLFFLLLLLSKFSYCCFCRYPLLNKDCSFHIFTQFNNISNKCKTVNCLVYRQDDIEIGSVGNKEIFYKFFFWNTTNSYYCVSQQEIVLGSKRFIQSNQEFFGKSIFKIPIQKDIRICVGKKYSIEHRFLQNLQKYKRVGQGNETVITGEPIAT